MPEHAALIPPDAILSLLMPRVVQRRDGTILSLVQAIKLYRSSEVSYECPCQNSTVPLPSTSLTWGEQDHIGLRFWSLECTCFLAGSENDAPRHHTVHELVANCQHMAITCYAEG
jgi:hypothetical protein